MPIRSTVILMDKVRRHFESEARQFDRIIRKLIPHYSEMFRALTAIPFETRDAIRVLDLGCGTGATATHILEKFPLAQVTCVDFAEKMVKAARHKLSRHRNVQFVVKDFREFEWTTTYHVVVSSLALHHLATDAEKIAFYRRVHAGLQLGGCFYIADLVLASSAHLQEAYLAKWKGYMRRTLPDEEIEKKWLPKYREEDHPAALFDQLEWLKKIGFKAVDVLWKYYNFAVYGGVKAGVFN
jgi:tRNA (cmo5U34)-methyltransferase